MTISDESWSNKLREIGEIERPDHFYLTTDHECVYFGEYTARKGWSHSSTNQIINNIKKHQNTRLTPQWHYKLREIERVGRLIRRNLKADALGSITFVPAPPSKCRTDPDYDDRIAMIAREVGGNIDVRCLLETSQTREPAHHSDERPKPAALVAGMRFRSEQLAAKPLGSQVIILDDVLVTGATFAACYQLIVEHQPDATVFGMFVARRVPERALALDEFDDWEV